jgi:hypothetical protein
MNELIQSNELDRILALHGAARVEIERSMRAAEAAARYISDLDDDLRAEYRFNREFLSVSDSKMQDDLELSIKHAHDEIDRITWRRVFDRCGFLALMDHKQREECLASLKRGEKIPPVTRENVLSTLEELRSRSAAVTRSGMVATFRRLSGDYATNQAFALGSKIIVSRAVITERYGSYSDSRVNDYAIGEIVDIDRAFRVADGKRPLEKTGETLYGDLCGAIRRKEKDFETGYFACRWHKAGTLHIAFKRPDLVDKINRWIAEACGPVLADRDRRKRRAS